MIVAVRRLVLAALVLLAPALAAAQQYTISPPPFLLAQNNSGTIINNACIWTYVAGTTTPAATYTTSTGTANTNPIRSDSAGRFTAYLSPGSSYKFVYESACTPPAHGTTLRTADNISAMPASSATVDVTGTAGESITLAQAVYLSDGSGGKTAGLWYKADAANTYSSTLNRVGVAMVNISAAGTGTIRLSGQATGLSSLSPGTCYYVGTAGALTSSAPANPRVVGQADSATSLVVTPDGSCSAWQVARGGTGLATGTSGGVLGFTATGTLASSAALTANDLVIGGGAGATPTSLGAQTANCIVAGPTSGSSAVVTCRSVNPLDLETGAVANVASQFDKTTNTTLADITGLTVTLTAGKTYHIAAVVHTTLDAAGGYKFGFGGTATATTFRYDAAGFIFAAGNPIIATGTSTAGTFSGTGPTYVKWQIDLYYVCNAGGTFTLQFAQSASSGTSSVLVGSHFDNH